LRLEGLDVQAEGQRGVHKVPPDLGIIRVKQVGFGEVAQSRFKVTLGLIVDQGDAIVQQRERVLIFCLAFLEDH
jgi:hypothetical protein